MHRSFPAIEFSMDKTEMALKKGDFLGKCIHSDIKELL